MERNTEGAGALCMHRVFESQAKRRPRAIALRGRDGFLTYGELNARADHLAVRLQERGVHQGAIVALSVHRSMEMIVSMLAILKCGAAYLPLDDGNPVARNRICLEEARASHLIADRACDELCDEARQILRTDDPSLFCSTAGELAPPGITAEDAAYVMFTSGSTGKPKGVVVPHRAVTRLVVATNYIQIAETDVILQFSPVSFDASTFEIWGALLNGASLALYSTPIPDPNVLRADIHEYGVTILWLTAALFHLIGHKYIEALRPLRILLAGGDVLSPQVVNKVLDALPGITLINGYGPTENTTFTCCHRMTTANRPPLDGVPIGKPITGTEVFILDEELQPVPPGEVGGLFAAGKGVALGYLNDNGGERFFHDERICSGLIYRTGDLVRENPSGEIEFVGRTDHQVKIRGFRISLEEVKLSILKIKGVVDAIVLPHKEEAGDQLLVAYIRTQQGCELSAAQAKRRLAEFLPRYMVPDTIVLRADLPITRNGKLDRTSLMSSGL
jgi:amino acid adenylation domain-containing protein